MFFGNEKNKKMCTMASLSSHKHALYEEVIKKQSLSAFDDKRYLLNNIDSYAYGHFRIKPHTETILKSNPGKVAIPVIYRNSEELLSIVNLDEQSFTIGHFQVTPCI